MGRPKGVNTECTSFSLNKEVLAKLNAYSEYSLISKTKIVEKAVLEYLDKVGFTQKEDQGEEIH